MKPKFWISVLQASDLHPQKKPVLKLPVTQKLSKEQMAVLNAVLSGKNVFFTGSAGILHILATFTHFSYCVWVVMSENQKTFGWWKITGGGGIISL